MLTLWQEPSLLITWQLANWSFSYSNLYQRQSCSGGRTDLIRWIKPQWVEQCNHKFSISANGKQDTRRNLKVKMINHHFTWAWVEFFHLKSEYKASHSSLAWENVLSLWGLLAPSSGSCLSTALDLKCQPPSSCKKCAYDPFATV